MQLYQLDNMIRGLFDEKRLHERIGSGWRLFFYLCLHVNKEKEFTTKYLNMSKDLGFSLSTLKTWRKYLVDNNVIHSFSGGNVVHFKLLEPYRSMLLENEQGSKAALLVPEIVKAIEETLKGR